MGQTGLAILQIMFYFSWPVVCIESRSNQLVAYYFIHGSTKAGLLKKFFEEVLCTCQNAGPYVIATVCDMGANIVSALQMLGATRRKPFFEFQNQEIVTVYDPPHILKCTRNLFRKYDV